MQRTLFGLVLLIAVGVALPAGASVIAYSAAPANLHARVVNTDAVDSGSNLSPFSVSASYPPPFEGSPSGNAQASVSSLLQSLAGFHIQGNLSATSVASSSQSLGSEAFANVQHYGFTISGPTMVYLRANVSRSVTGFDPGVGFFKANVCPAVGVCNPMGVDGLGTGVLGGVSFTGTSFLSAVELAGGSYILDFYIYDKVFGDVPGGTGTASDGFSVDLQFEPFSTTVDDGPIAAPEGVAKVIPVGANDTGFTNPVTVTVTTPPTKGVISAISPPGPAAGMTITYTANVGESGPDSFVYEMTDGTPASDSATVALNIGPDADADNVLNAVDNCTLLANPTQCDSDGDGFGNRCDGDLNNNTATNSQDYVLFRAQLGQASIAPTYNQADLNCNGVVNSQDYVLFRGLLGSAPGPSGLVP